MSIIMVIIAIVTVVCALRGNVPIAIIGAMCLLTTIHPILGFFVAIAVLIITAIMGCPTYGLLSFGGFILGAIVLVIVGALIAAGFIIAVEETASIVPMVV